MVLVLRLLLAIALISTMYGCPRSVPSQPSPSTGAEEGSGAPRVAWVQFDSGALIRAHLEDRTTVIAMVIAPRELRHEMLSAPDTAPGLIVCELSAACTEDPRGSRTIAWGSIRRLEVRGKQTGLFGYAGFLGGALAGSLATDSDDTSGVLFGIGAFGGMAVGALLGSRITGWVLVFPCYHGCAYGRYPSD